MVNFLICINRLLHSIHATHSCRIIWCKWVSIPVSTNGTNLLCWELLIHMIHYPILLGFQMLKLNQQHVWILIYSPIFWYVKALGFSSVKRHKHRSNQSSTLKFLFLCSWCAMKTLFLALFIFSVASEYWVHSVNMPAACSNCNVATWITCMLEYLSQFLIYLSHFSPLMLPTGRCILSDALFFSWTTHESCVISPRKKKIVQTLQEKGKAKKAPSQIHPTHY